MANDAMAVCAAGSMGVGPGAKRRFLRNIQRILGIEMNLVYRNRVALRAEGRQKPLTTKDTKSHKRFFVVAFSSCTFVPFVVVAFRRTSIIANHDAQRTDTKGHHHCHEGTR